MNNNVRQYLVLKRRGKWCVKSLGRFGKPCSSETKALQSAIVSAEKNSKTGKPTEVTLFIKYQNQRIVWESGKGGTSSGAMGLGSFTTPIVQGVSDRSVQHPSD